MFRRFQIIVSFALAIAPAGAFGDTAQEEFSKLRSAFEAKIAATGEPQLRLYLRQLESLERTLASKGDYRGAIQARDEATAIKRQIAALLKRSGENPGDVSEGGVGRIILRPGSASVAGAVIWDRDADVLRGWRSADDIARWQLPNLQSGGYEVILEFVAGTSEGGEFVISEEFFRLTGEIGSTDGRMDKKNFGTLKIRTGQGFVTISPTRTDLNGLMRLKSIELVPAWR